MAVLSEKVEHKHQETSVSESFSDKLDSLIKGQKAFYRTGATRDFEFRKTQLQKLRKLILKNEKAINQAIQDDLKRPNFIATFTTGGVITEIDYALERVLTIRPPFVTRRMKKWMSPQKKRTPVFLLGNKSYVQQVPKGVTLIIGPWNYPFLLLAAPLVGAMAAGNTAVIKPSEYAPNTSSMITKLINENFDADYIHVVEGGVEESKHLVNREEWDHLFFTGGTEIGRSIYHESAKHLTPVTLELGGKSPTIVDKSAHIKNTAKRLVSTKFINNGQTCMAPDYLLVHEDVKDDLIEAMKVYIKKFFGDEIENSNDYARIISDRHYSSLESLLSDNGNIAVGGDTNPSNLYISPTIIDGVSYDSDIMKDEIFGPILPIISWNDVNEIINFIEDRPHPLALYIYTSDKKFREKVLSSTHFGGGMINDSVLYYLHPELPFGGVGDSGMGAYGGKYTFDEFSHTRPLVIAGGFFDRFLEKVGIKFFHYPPYNGFKLRLLKLFHRTFSRFRM